MLLNISCEKVVDINLNNATSQLVIEGNITNQSSTQTVKISRTVPISDPNVFPGVSNAIVTITDNTTGKVSTLTEQSPGMYVTTALKGQQTKTYKLKVIADGNEYTATSTMPSQVNLEYLKLYETTFFNQDLKSVDVFYIDPLYDINYYRFILSINNIPSKNIFIYTDEFDEGRLVYKELQDFDRNPISGDVIDIEMQCIDKNIYHYWDGLDQNQNRGGSLTIPANPESNISNHALGYFSAHTTQHKSLIVP